MRFSTTSFSLFFFLLLSITPMLLCQQILITKPTQLARSFSSGAIPIRMSPIGFRPQTGTLHGRIVLSDPSSACGNQIKSFEDNQEDLFVLVDDEGCLESIKAKNVANSGAFMMLIKRNIYNTLRDKESNSVHIPVAQLQPSDWNTLQAFMLNNTQTIISSQADFGSLTSLSPKQIRLQFWLSPTQKQAYEYVSQMTSFIKALISQTSISFKPHFVLHSQSRQMQYLGCLSNGRYCAPQLEYEGQPESAKIVSEELRQIVILQTKGVEKWLDYCGFYFAGCLGVELGFQFNGRSTSKNDKGKLWKDNNSEMCSEGAMMSAGIDAMEIFKEYDASFMGPRPEVDPNTYLEQQLQLYQYQPPNSLPSIILNSKQFSFEQMSPLQLKLRICNTISLNPDSQPAECQKITNPALFSSGQILIIIAVLINVLICLMIICKEVIKRKMKGEIQQQVSGTLEQYYKYMNMGEDMDVNVTGVNKGNQQVSFDEERQQRNRNGLQKSNSKTKTKPSVEMEEFSYS